MRLALMALSWLPIAPAGDLPNVLWLTSEDHGPELGCYGDELATTPEVDALAAAGMRFARAWSNAPVCAPARTTIITGMYASSLGAQHMRSMVPLPEGVRLFPALLRELGYYCTNRSKEDYNVPCAEDVWDVSSKKAHYEGRAPGQPFFAVFNSTVSHESRIRTRPHEAVHDPARVRLPAYHPDLPEVRQDWAQYYDIVTRADAAAGERLAELEQAGLNDDTIVFYFADHGSGMPRSKRWTHDSGLSVPMVVYFPERWRHLAPDGYEAGGTSDRLVSFVDLAPTMLSLAGAEPAGWMQGHAFAGEHRTTPPKYMFGFRGRMDERHDCVRTVTDGRYQYIRNYQPQRIYGQYVMYGFQTPATAAWKRAFDAGELNEAQSRFWLPKPSEELYDLEADPDEVHDLCGSVEHRAKRRELAQALGAWMLETRDTGLLPEGELHARSAGRAPADMTRDPETYPFGRIYAAATVATQPLDGDLPRVLTALRDEDAAVRYWAVLGIALRGEEVVRGLHERLLTALEDPSPSVRLAAAQALAQHGEEADAERGLELLVAHAHWSGENDVFVVTAALQALDELDEAAAPALETLRALPSKGGPSPSKRYDMAVDRLLQKTLADLAGDD